MKIDGGHLQPLHPGASYTHMDASVVVPDVTFTVNYSYHLEVGTIMGVHPV